MEHDSALPASPFDTEKESSMRLKDRVAIVTGAAHGIGRAIAELFAREGARVLAVDLDDAAGAEVVAGIKAAGGTAQYLHVDVASESDVARMAETAIAAFGGINILVNNAAAFIFGSLEKTSRAQWERVMAVNVLGPASCIKAVLPAMRKAGGGSVVNIASVSGFIAQPDFVPYNSSKGAALQMSKCLAMDLAKDNVRVNAICPGTILTRATEAHIKSAGLQREGALRAFADETVLKRLGEPIEIAFGALFLASDEASYVTGAQLVIDGGRTID